MTTKYNLITSPVVIVALLLGAIVSTISPAQPSSAQTDASCPNAYPVDPSTPPNGSWGFMDGTPFQPSGHTGLDWMREDGTSVYATGSGTVTWASWWPANMPGKGHGPTVWILHESCGDGKLSSVYAHLDGNIQVVVGQKVERGTLLGFVGPDGESGAGDGSHLHYAKNYGGDPNLGNEHGGQWQDPTPSEANIPLIPAISADAALQPQSPRIVTQNLSKIPTPILIGVVLAAFFALGLANQRTRGVAALSLLVILVTGFAYFALYHREEINIPRDPLAWMTVPTPAPPPDQAEQPVGCEISPKYPADIQRWCALITSYAHLRGFDPNLIAAQILQESGGDPEVLSHSGAVGLMQVMPHDGIAAGFLNDQGEPYFATRPTIAQLKDPTFNVDYGTGMMEGLRNKFSEGYSEEQRQDPAIQRDILREVLKKYGPIDRGYEYADIVLAIWDNYR